MIKYKNNSKKNLFWAVFCLFCINLILPNNAISQAKITSPTSTDSLFVGEPITISWNIESSEKSTVSLYYSDDSGKSWKEIATNLKTNSYEWIVPYVNLKELKLKLTTVSLPSLNVIYENTLAHSGNIISMVCDFSSDGKYFLSCGDDGYFRIWDIARKSLFKEFKTGKKDAKIYCAKFKNNVDTVIFSADNEVFLWDSQTNCETQLFALENVAFSLDLNNTKNILGCCSQRGGEVVLYSFETNSIIEKIAGIYAKDEYYRCRFSPDGTKFAFVSYNNYINLYDIDSKQLKYFYADKIGENGIWGLDFSFDNSEIIATDLSKTIRRIDAKNMNLLAEYDELQPSNHIRAIRYINEQNDFISGGVHSKDLLLGNFEHNIFDTIFVNYEITDVEYYSGENGKFIGIAGREPRKFGKFTIFRFENGQISTDEITVNAYYKFNLNIPKITEAVNKNINFELNFSTVCEIDSIPFATVPAKIFLAFPSNLLNVKTGEFEKNQDDAMIYSYSINDLKNTKNKHKIFAKTLLSDINSAKIWFDDYISDNEMIVIHSNESEIAIIPDCEADAERNISFGEISNLNVIERDDEFQISAKIASDDGYNLSVSDINGTIIANDFYQKAGNYLIKLQKSQLISGAYLIKLSSDSGFEAVKKIILSPK